MKNITRNLLKGITLLALGAGSLTAGQEFDFKDPKGVNSVQFNLDAPLEAISGSGNGVSGTVKFDIEHPEKTSGYIKLDATSLTVPNPVMKEHLHGENWLNTSEYGTIKFVAEKLSDVKVSGEVVKAEIHGKLTLKGVTKEVAVPVKMTYLPGMLSARTNGAAEGDLLVLRAKFVINRSDYGIMPGKAEDKVSEEIELSLALAGAAPKG